MCSLHEIALRHNKKPDDETLKEMCDTTAADGTHMYNVFRFLVKHIEDNFINGKVMTYNI